MKKLLLFFCSLVITPVMEAQIIHVPADYPTIQQAIDTANNGDTVLVSPGTYVENINFVGKNITVASLFLTTQDTSYISQTIIDGDQTGSVVTILDADSTTVLSGFKITNGNDTTGGGIHLKGSHSKPCLQNLKITNNTAQFGGGIGCQPHGGFWGFGAVIKPKLMNVTIMNNNAELGGGIFFTSGCRGFCYLSGADLQNVTISDNLASQSGGGIYLGTYEYGEQKTSFKNVTIKNNIANQQGGGMYCACYIGVPAFDSIEKCNIYQNSSIEGNDLFSNAHMGQCIIKLDTFTVTSPKEFHAAPFSKFSFDIQHGYHEQVNGDLYVSPMGDDTNSGLTADEPLKTIHSAYSFILSDPVNQNTIHLLQGIYSPSVNDEFFPLIIKDSIHLEGISESLVILNADSLTRVMQFKNSYNILISDMTITGGKADIGAGIYCFNSNPFLKRTRITGNSANENGGGIYCDNADPNLENVTITGNSAQTGGGIYCHANSAPLFDSVNRSNIYFNSAFEGKDLFSESFVKVILDTFSVLYPTGFYAKPISNFSFNILHGKITQVNADLFVSPEGDNSNSGLNESEPLKNIQYAFSIIRADSLNKNCIRLHEGTYSPSSTGESFPLNIPDYISLEGIVDILVILNAESAGSVIYMQNNHYNRISGLTITGGSGSYGNWGYGNGCFGGGIFCNNSDPWLNKMIISDNGATFGAGIYCYFSDPILENVTILRNSASYGGGILSDNSNPALNNVVITENAAYVGGGICCNSSSPILKNVRITNNIADYGGGISCSSFFPDVENVIIADNIAVINGGGIYCWFGQGYSTLKNVTITGNSAENGGGIWFHDANAYLKNVIITANIANDRGGGIYCNQYSSITLGNVTIIGNSAASGGGIYSYFGNSVNITNTIMWNDNPEEIVLFHFTDTITINFSDVLGGEAGIVGGTVNWLEGNINEDPLFTGGSEHPYSLSDGSPCIDSGTPDTTGLNLPLGDVIGNKRIWDGDGDGIAVVDMGAYEYGAIPVGTDKPAVDSQWLAVSSYPNPFRDYTTFVYELKEYEAVSVSIFDHLGQMVAEPLNAYQSKGEQQFEWNSGRLPAGMYYYRIQAGKHTGSGKMVKN